MNFSRDPDTIFNGSCIVVKDTVVTLPIFLLIVSFFFFSSPFFLRTLSPLTLDTLFQVEPDPVLAEMFEFPVSLVFDVHETMPSNHDRWKIDGSIRGAMMENQLLMSRQISARAI